MNKKYAGTLENWYKIEFPELKDKYLDLYGPNLGYMVRGNLGQDHKNRGFDNAPVRTSLVVAEQLNEAGQLVMVETLNSFYDLGDPFSDG